jgi:hypothetical protein
MLAFKAAPYDEVCMGACVEAWWLLLLPQVLLTWTAADRAGNKGTHKHAPQHLHLYSRFARVPDMFELQSMCAGIVLHECAQFYICTEVFLPVEHRIAQHILPMTATQVSNPVQSLYAAAIACRATVAPCSQCYTESVCGANRRPNWLLRQPHRTS